MKKSLLFFLLVLGFLSCSSESDSIAELDDNQTPTTNPLPKPVLNSISPTSGPKMTLVTIIGNDFGTDIGRVTVYFNEIEAEVQSIENDKIIAVVPARAFTGVVTVEIDGTTLTGPEFTYIISDVQVTTLAGNNIDFVLGYEDGTGTDARFNWPTSIDTDIEGNIYVADTDNNKIRKITPEGAVTTLAGSTLGYSDGTGADAQFFLPTGVALDSEGNVYVADYANDMIRKITRDGVVTTLAGSTRGFADGTSADAQFFNPTGIALDPEGNSFVADYENHKIRKITPDGVVTTLAGSSNGYVDGIGADAQFSNPYDVALDAEGNVYVADTYNNKIRKITPDGIVTTVAGSGNGYADGTGTDAQFYYPQGLEVGPEGNVYVADTYNNKIRKITPEGAVTTLAGSTLGYSDGTGADAKFSWPTGVALDLQGNIYVADQLNSLIRKITQE